MLADQQGPVPEAQHSSADSKSDSDRNRSLSLNLGNIDPDHYSAEPAWTSDRL